MRKGLGLGILALGVVGLGWWGSSHNAHRIEHKVRSLAEAAVTGTVHPITTTVAGRDIHVAGIANGQDEADAIMAQLNALPPRRKVTADLTVLDTISPYTIDITKDAATLTAAGHIPTEAFRADLGALGDAATGLALGAGAPEGWGDLVKGGLAAMGHMNTGALKVSDGALTLTGEANGPEEAAAIDAALAALPAGSVTKDITLLDDGTPVGYAVEYSANTGATASGKLPKGIDLAAIAGALGLSGIAGEVKQAMTGADGDLGLFAKLKGVLGQIETFKLDATADTQSLNVGVQGGVDSAAAQAALDGAAPGLTVAVETVAATGENGAMRDNLATGMKERFMGGYWLAVPQIDVGLEGCQAAADGVLAADTINFVTGSDELDSSSLRVINSLASIMARCSEEAGLKAVIGGHTDSVGDPTANLGLSQRRATAVRRELVARGVPGAALKSLGYGAEQPIADNETDEGRAKNRRTTIIWSN